MKPDNISPTTGQDLLQTLSQVVKACNRPDIQTVESLLRLLVGNANATSMCRRLLMWLPRSTQPDGAVYKSWRDWQAECQLSQDQIKRVHASGYLERVGFSRRLKKVNGAPTNHYRLNPAAFMDALAVCLGVPATQIRAWMGDVVDWSNETETNSTQGPDATGHADRLETLQTTQSTTHIIPTKTHQQKQPTIQQPIAVEQTGRDLAARLQALGIKPELVKELLAIYEVQRIEAVLAYMQQRPRTNPGGFVIRALREQWLVPASITREIVGLPEDGQRYVTGKYAEFIRTC